MMDCADQKEANFERMKTEMVILFAAISKWGGSLQAECEVDVL